MKRENLRKVAEELIWYGGKDEDGRWPIFICVDFDYTITKKGSWRTGIFIENPHCFETLRKWAEKYNCKYCLDTMRGARGAEGPIEFCRENGIEFAGIGINPYQHFGEGMTTKCWGVYIIDDRNPTCLVWPEDGDRPYVDWYKIDEVMTPILEELSALLPEMEEEVLYEKAMVESASTRK